MLKRGVNRKKNKIKQKGLSSIIATLLIIIVTLIAIVIVWMIVRNIVINQTEAMKAQKEFFSETVEISYFKNNDGVMSISLEKTGGSKIKTSEQKQAFTITEIIESDIISVVDLSLSMIPACNQVNLNCCIILGGSYSSGNCLSRTNSLIDESVCLSPTCNGIWVDKISSIKEANKELIEAVLSKSIGSRIGLVGYNTAAVISASTDLTHDQTQLNNKIDSWNNLMLMPGTCICCGINEAVNQLQESSDDRTKKIIVMSDGLANQQCIEQNTGNPTQDAIKAACDAKTEFSDKLTIYSVGFGEDINEDALTAISDCGGGKYFSALDTNELIDVYTRISEEIKVGYKSVQTLNYLYIVFYNGTDSYKEKISEMPDVLEIKNYQIDLTGKREGKITKIEVYPVIITNSGKEITGPPSDVWE